MTRNQLEYQRLMEDKRKNRENERISEISAQGTKARGDAAMSQAVTAEKTAISQRRLNNAKALDTFGNFITKPITLLTGRN